MKLSDEELRRLIEESTPGPWSQTWDDDGFYYINEIRASFSGSDLDKDAAANAALIAAAPDLARELLSLRSAGRWIPVTERLPEFSHRVVRPPAHKGDSEYVYETSDWVETWHPDGCDGDSSIQTKRIIQRRISYVEEPGNWVHKNTTYWRELCLPPSETTKEK